MPIKRKVQQLITLYDTHEPHKLATSLDTLIFYEKFKNIWGYYNTSKRIKMIHVNSSLDEWVQRFVIAHELGHLILHPKINVPFLKAHTLLSEDKIERQANEFAVELLIPDKLLLEGATIYEAAAICGVPQEVAYLKEAPKQRGFGRDEHPYINL